MVIKTDTDEVINNMDKHDEISIITNDLLNDEKV